MKKVYIVVSVQPSTGRVEGLFGPDREKDLDHWEVNEERSVRYRDAAPELREQMRETVVDKFPDEAEELMANSGDKAILFTRRKAARVVAANLNEAGSWDWRVIECGPPAARDMRPVLGWRIMFDNDVSAHNPDFGKGMFPSRAEARKYFRGDVTGEDLRKYKGGDTFYRIEPVYGAYRVDPKQDGKFYEGALRFRTKRAAEQFAREFYPPAGYRVVLSYEEVPESHLYYPL